MSDLLFDQKQGYSNYELPKAARALEWDKFVELYPHICWHVGLEDMNEAWLTCRSQRDRPDLPAYVVELADTCQYELIFVKDKASLMELRAKLAPMVAAESVAGMLASKVVERAFRAWHGHDASDACHQCDPKQARRNEEHRAEWRKTQAERAARKVAAAPAPAAPAPAKSADLMQLLAAAGKPEPAP